MNGPPRMAAHPTEASFHPPSWGTRTAARRTINAKNPVTAAARARRLRAGRPSTSAVAVDDTHVALLARRVEAPLQVGLLALAQLRIAGPQGVIAVVHEIVRVGRVIAIPELADQPRERGLRHMDDLVIRRVAKALGRVRQL